VCVYSDGVGWIGWEEPSLCGASGDTGPERSQSGGRRRVTPSREPGRAPHARRHRRGLSLLGAPDYRLARGISRPSLSNRLREEAAAALLGIKLNIWTLPPLPLFLSQFLSLSPSLPLSSLSLSRSLSVTSLPLALSRGKTKPGSRRPSPTRGLEERRKPKVALQPRSSGRVLSLAHLSAAGSHRGADLKNRSLRERETTPEARTPKCSTYSKAGCLPARAP
jgi:hypothetical protein